MARLKEVGQTRYSLNLLITFQVCFIFKLLFIQKVLLLLEVKILDILIATKVIRSIRGLGKLLLYLALGRGKHSVEKRTENTRWQTFVLLINVALETIVVKVDILFYINIPLHISKYYYFVQQFYLATVFSNTFPKFYVATCRFMNLVYT